MGSRGAWGSAMPPTVVYLRLVHAPVGGVDSQGVLHSTAPLAGVLTLQQCSDTLVFHRALPSAFFLPSAQPQGYPDETKVRGALLSDCERRLTGMSLKRASDEEMKRKSGIVCFSK